MKNSKGFYIKSAACRAAEEDGKMCISFKCPEQEARALYPLVEWHHGGAGVIAFFPANEKEVEASVQLRAKKLRLNICGNRKVILKFRIKSENTANFSIFGATLTGRSAFQAMTRILKQFAIC